MDLRERWNGLVDRWFSPAGTGRGGYDDLVEQYGTPPRAYHTLAHVGAMLELLDGYDVPERETVELAVWFHDAVYDTRRSDNEERSADLADEWLRLMRRAPAVRERVRTLVLATKTHAPTPDHAVRWLLDADLAVLGGAPDEYDRYARAIREEYAWVPGAAFREGRAKVLAAFLGRPFIYQTPELRARFESAARENLARELAALE